MLATICALSSALILIVGAAPTPLSTTAPGGNGSVTFSVGTLSCANATTRVNLSSVSVSVLYVDASRSLSNGTNDTNTGSYSWNAGANYTEDTGLSGEVSIILDASVPSQCPWAGKTWSNWSDVGDGSAIDVAITFVLGPGSLGNGNWSAGNSTVTVSPPAPTFPYFLDIAGLGPFCVFLYWGLTGWRKLASLVSGDVS